MLEVRSMAYVFTILIWVTFIINIIPQMQSRQLNTFSLESSCMTFFGHKSRFQKYDRTCEAKYYVAGAGVVTGPPFDHALK